jgi:hypothetical protein
MEDRITQLQKIADQAEKQIQHLEKQLEEIKTQNEEDSNTFKMNILKQLQHLRQSLLLEQREAQGAIAQKKELSKEKEELLNENAKLKYRIKILLRSLEEEENKNASWNQTV